MKSSLTKSKKIIYAVLFAFTIFFAMPSIPLPSKANFDQQASLANAQTQVYNTKIERVDSVLKNPTVFQAKYTSALAMIPQGPDMPGLISLLQSAALASGMEWVNGSPQAVPGTMTSGSPTWSMTVSVIGSPVYIPTFLINIRHLSRLLVVDSVSYQSATANSVTATIVIKFFSSGSSDAK